jgi:hypothetical protein
MAADGVWKITVNSPMGAQESTWRLNTDGTALEGSSEGGPGGPVEAKDGKVDGGHLTWSASITSPFPMTLEFDVNVEGDSMTGQVKAGSFGHSPLSGVRVG